MDAKPTRDGYGRGLLAVGKENNKVVALDCDLSDSTRSAWFGREFPDRFFQMGIAEQDMVVTAAGLASCGKIPFASTFSIFMERGFEQVRNAVARPNLNVKIIGSHGGIMTGEDGGSAHSIEDVAIYRALPNMTIVIPADVVEAEKAVWALAEHKGPCFMKLTREKVPTIFDETHNFQIGKGTVVRDGTDAAVIACGPLVGEAVLAHEMLKEKGVAVRVINMSTIKPLDRELVVAAARECGCVVTAEDHNIIGGLGSAVAECLAEECPTPIARVGVQDVFAESGKPRDLYEKYGLTAENIAKNVKEVLEKKKR